MTINERLETIEATIKQFDLDSAAESLVELAVDYDLLDSIHTLIRTEDITTHLLARIGNDYESGWQAAYISLKNIESTTSNWYRIDGYNNLHDLTSDDLEVILDRLTDDLADQIAEEEAEEVDEEDEE